MPEPSRLQSLLASQQSAHEGGLQPNADPCAASTTIGKSGACKATAL
eukprot:SAG25_NODE_7177_length_499_cov_0.695000_1_plen_46_part_10